MEAQAKPPWVRRALTFTGGTMGRLLLFVCFLSSLLVGAIGHLDLKVSRRVAAQLITGVVSDSLRGTIQVGSFTHLGRSKVAVDHVAVLDPDGRTTIRIKNLSVELDLFGILDRVLSSNEKLSIEVERVRAEDCEVYLLPTKEKDENGNPLSHPSLADAFESVKKTQKKKSPGRPIRLWFPRIRLTNVYAHGSIGSSPVLDIRIKSAGGRVLATDKGASIDIHRFQMLLSGIGGVDTRAHGEVHIRAPGAIWGDIAGRFGEVPIIEQFRFENGNIDIKGEFPELAPEALRPLLGSWPLDQTIAVSHRVTGKAPTLAASASISSQQSDKSRAEVLGVLRLEPALSLDVKLTTSELDLQHYLSTLPESSLSSQVKVRVRPQNGAVEAVFEGQLNEGRIAEEKTPAAVLSGKFDKEGLLAKASFEEKGLEAEAELTYSDQAGSFVSLHLHRFDLQENERAKKYGAGTNGVVSGDLAGSTHDGKFEARADLNVTHLSNGAVSVQKGKIEAKVAGSLESPQEAALAARADLLTLEAGPAHIKSATLEASGPLLRPKIDIKATTEKDLELRATTASNLGAKRLQHLKLSVTGRGKPISAEADELSFANSRIKVRNLVMKSIGEVRGDLDFGEGGGQINLEAERLSVSRIASNLGFPKNEYGGDLNAAIHLFVGQRSEGTVDVEVTDGALFGIDNVNIDAHATIEGQSTRGNVNGSISKLGELQSSWEGTLAGPLHQATSYTKALGQGHVALRNLDLKGLTLLLGKSLGLPDLDGTITASLDVRRDDADQFPEAEFSFDTKDFEVIHGNGQTATRITGQSPEGGFSVRPSSNLVEGVVRLRDRYGTLASLSASLTLPLDEWGRSLPSAEVFEQTLRSAPLNAAAIIPRRRVDRFPLFLSLPIEEGSIALRASANGSVDAPRLTIMFDSRKLNGEASPFSRPIDFALNANYLPYSGEFRGGFGLTSDGNQAASGQAELHIPVDRLLEGPKEGQPLWTGFVQLQLDNTALSLLRELRKRGVRGTAQGAISLTRSGYDSQLSSEVRLRALEFGGQELGDALLELQTYDEDIVARAQFTDDYGSLTAALEGGIIYSPELFEFASKRPVYVSLESDKYDAALLHPFAADVLEELSGSLSGKLKAELTPPATEDGNWSASMSGAMKMSDGVITPSALGLRLEDVGMNMAVGPEGTMNVIRINDISAKADSPRPNLKGNALLYLQDLSLQGGTFHLSPTDVPLKGNDAELARLTGTAQGRFDMTREVTRVELRINNLEATLPERSDSNLFTLDENPTIEVLQRPTAKEEESTEEPSAVTELKFFLGRNVRIKSELLDIKLRGEPEMRLGDDLKMRGSLELIPGGRMLVMARHFTVEEGTVLFDTADAADPHLSISAAWQAPNGVRVRVTVSGTASKPQLSWSSEPALPGGEAEVIALVLGGGGGSTDQGQVSFTSGIFYAANEAIGTKTNRIQIYSTQETSGAEGRVASLNDSSWNAYTATYRISDELWFEGSWEKANGTSPQTEARSSGISGTLDWRFHPHWSLRSEIGSLGAGLDLVWRYRY